MAKKKSCQNVCCLHVLSVDERELYGWVDEEVFYQSSVVTSDMLPELRHEMRLIEGGVSEGDYVIEAVGPSDRLPFQAAEDRTHFLWVYTELFTRLCVRLPFTNFQKEVMTRCPVAASQHHLNGWGFLEPLSMNASISVFAHRGMFSSTSFSCTLLLPERGLCLSGRKLFDAFEESIQEFKWHYFKVLPLPGRRPFWLDDEGTPFPWVYWNSKVGDYRITALDPLETLAFQFLQSLSVGLGKKSKFMCRCIVDHSDAEVGVFLDSLLRDMDKQSQFDRLQTRMAEVEGSGPRSILPASFVPTASGGASASTLATVVPPGPSSGATKIKKKASVTSIEKPISV
ncbi:hypothetical protein PIB30_090438 [Stylosanthes scabra]|uniref:Uncharacterized protein n=1 Tax=Stylosanthes scabra TaxID=79078 RepID=A0ABU6XWR6_9FABA|nr:hypothetical protein [Stylosanthes scabra]